MSRPIGVLGGIFDPVHNGHLAMALLAYDYFDLESIVFIPAGVPPHKLTTVTASPADRLAMLKIAVANFSGATIWEHEVQYSGISYTIDTIDALASAFHHRQIYFIIGADNLIEIPAWHRYDEILEKVTLCVAARPGFGMEVPAALASARILFFPSPQWSLSSTVLRSYFSQGYSCKYMLPDGVQEYIMKNGLYKYCSTKDFSRHSSS
jgi:nicotinate-nucleotide adenylyltransferase